MVVGRTRTSFTVHKLSICSKAPFFEKATSASSNWTEAKEKTVTLHDTDPDVLEAYRHWVYTEKIELDSISLPWQRLNPAKIPSYLSIAKIWVSADMMLDHHLCNRLSNLAVHKLHGRENFSRSSIVRFVWDYTAPTSKLRTLFLDIFSSRGDAATWFEQEKLKYPREFNDELSSRFLRGESRIKIAKNISEQDICSRYHIHPEGAECGA